MLLHTLSGQYEAIIGELDVVFHKQQHFREMWKKVEVFTSFGERIKWRIEICSTKIAFSAPRLGRTSILDV